MGSRKAPAKKRLSAAARRQVILEAAQVRFAEAGYAGTSIDDIAAAAGVTKPVVYDHFPSKQKLYFAVMRGLRDELLGAAATSLSSAAGPRERFQTAIGTFFEQVQREPAFVKILFVQSRTEPELTREWERLQAEALAALKPLVRALAPKLDRWQVDVTAQFLHHGLNSTAEVWPKGVSAEDMARLVSTIMWQGLETFSRHASR